MNVGRARDDIIALIDQYLERSTPKERIDLLGDLQIDIDLRLQHESTGSSQSLPHSVRTSDR